MKKVIISIAALTGYVSVEHYAMSMVSKDPTMQLPPVPVATKSVSVPEQPQALERSKSEEIFDLEDIDQYSLLRDRQSVWSEVESQSINQPYTQDLAALMVDEKRAAEEPQLSSNPYNLSLAEPNVPLSAPAMADEGEEEILSTTRKRKKRFASLAEDAMQPAHDEYNIPAVSVPVRQGAFASSLQQKNKKRTFTASQMAEDSGVKQPKIKKSRIDQEKKQIASDYHFDLTNEEGHRALTFCMAQMEKKWLQFKKKEPEIFTSFEKFENVLRAFITCVLKKQYAPENNVPICTGRVWNFVGKAVAESLKNETLAKHNLGKNMSALRVLFRKTLSIFEDEYNKGLFAETGTNSAPARGLLLSAIKTIQKATKIDGDPNGKEVKWRTSRTVAQARNNTAVAVKHRVGKRKKHAALKIQ